LPGKNYSVELTGVKNPRPKVNWRAMSLLNIFFLEGENESVGRKPEGVS